MQACQWTRRALAGGENVENIENRSLSILAICRNGNNTDRKGEIVLDFTIRKGKRGSLTYTDRYQSYNGLFSYGFRYERIDHGK